MLLKGSGWPGQYFLFLWVGQGPGLLLSPHVLAGASEFKCMTRMSWLKTILQVCKETYLSNLCSSEICNI